MVKLLAISASTKIASVAIGSAAIDKIYDGKQVSKNVSIRYNDVFQNHSEFLNIAVDECLREQNLSPHEIKLVCVDVGPGSFTGVRAAINVARAFSYCEKVPVITKTSLELVELQNSSGTIICLNAQKNKTFWRYQGKTELLDIPEAIQRIQRIQKAEQKPLNLAGDLSEIILSQCEKSLSERISVSSSENTLPSAGTFFKVDIQKFETLDWNYVTPIYLRASSAEENLRNKNSRDNLKN